MSTEKTEEKRDKAGRADFWSTSKGFQEMVGRMSKCCTDQDGSIDCSAMMKAMMGTCCAPKAENPKGERRK